MRRSRCSSNWMPSCGCRAPRLRPRSKDSTRACGTSKCSRGLFGSYSERGRHLNKRTRTRVDAACPLQPPPSAPPPGGWSLLMSATNSCHALVSGHDVSAPPATSMLSTPEKAAPSSSGASGVENSHTLSVSSGVGPPSYPPSEVRRWMVCPTFWRDSLTWEPRADRWTPHALVGTAIHAGVATLLRGLDEDPVHAAIQALGEGYVEQETWSLLTLSKLVEKGYLTLRDAIQERFPSLNPAMVEQSDPNQDVRIVRRGRAYRVVDFVCEGTEGLEVWDWKTKINLDDAYLGEALRAVMHSWQLLDYSYHVQQFTR